MSECHISAKSQVRKKMNFSPDCYVESKLAATVLQKLLPANIAFCLFAIKYNK